MEAAERRQHPELRPADIQLDVGPAMEPPDVVAPKRVARQRDRKAGPQRRRQILPSRVGVARPLADMALAPGPSRAGPHNGLFDPGLSHHRGDEIVVDQAVGVVQPKAGQPAVSHNFDGMSSPKSVLKTAAPSLIRCRQAGAPPRCRPRGWSCRSPPRGDDKCPRAGRHR